jgi:hypothetical protein
MVERRYEFVDGDKCLAEVVEICWDGFAMEKTIEHYRQCTRKRGHGPNGEYCRQHSKKHGE